jgi:hypothetical protein
MKKLILLAAMAVLGLQAQAQIVSSRSSMVTKVEQPKNGWKTFGFEYLPSSIDADGHSESHSAVSILWTKARSLTASQPIFLETGFGLQYSWWSDGDKDKDGKKSWWFGSVKVPINVIYSYNIPNTSIHLDPYVGINLRLNVYGQYKYEDKNNDFDYALFDDDEYEPGKGYKVSRDKWNRFQVGWHIGCRARFNDSFFVGVAYGKDFSEIAEKCKIAETTLTAGFVF